MSVETKVTLRDYVRQQVELGGDGDVGQLVMEELKGRLSSKSDLTGDEALLLDELLRGERKWLLFGERQLYEEVMDLEVVRLLTRAEVEAFREWKGAEGNERASMDQAREIDVAGGEEGVNGAGVKEGGVEVPGEMVGEEDDWSADETDQQDGAEWSGEDEIGPTDDEWAEMVPEALVVDEELNELERQVRREQVNGGEPDIDDALGWYFREIRETELLTAQEEIELAKRIERGWEAGAALRNEDVDVEKVQGLQELVDDGQAAREHLARANTRLVVSIAKRYLGQGLPFLDLIQEGNLGMMRAVDKFDYRRGYKFSTYATWWIRQGITRALLEKSRTIRLPLHLGERIRRMYRIASEMELEQGCRPTPEEIAEKMELPPVLVRWMMKASQHPRALEEPMGEDGESEFGDFVEDEDSLDPAEAAAQHMLTETIEEVMSELTPREARILRLRFGLGGGEPHTLEEIGKKCGVSRERIRQLEGLALRRLKHPSVQIKHHLRDHLT